jgi:hypothetical protein
MDDNDELEELFADSTQETASHRATSHDDDMTEDSTTVNGHTVRYETKHMGHMELGLKWLHNHHKEAEVMFKTLKNGEEPEHKGYMKFEVSGYKYRLYKKTSGYKLVWKQA